jgi:hypothetical protein
MFFGGLYFALFTKEKRDGIGADGSDNGEWGLRSEEERAMIGSMQSYFEM